MTVILPVVHACINIAMAWVYMNVVKATCWIAAVCSLGLLVDVGHKLLAQNLPKHIL